MNTKRFLFLLLIVSLFIISVRAVEIYPTNWWTGMKYNQIQLMLYAPENNNFSKENIVIDYPGIDVLKKNVFENGKYIILDLKINETTRPGTIKISFLKSTFFHFRHGRERLRF